MFSSLTLLEYTSTMGTVYTGRPLSVETFVCLIGVKHVLKSKRYSDLLIWCNSFGLWFVAFTCKSGPKPMSFVQAVSSRRSELVSSSERRLRYSCDLSSLMRKRMAAAYVATPSLRECNRFVSGEVAPSLSIKSALSLSAANSHKTPAATRCFGIPLNVFQFQPWHLSMAHLNVFDVAEE